MMTTPLLLAAATAVVCFRKRGQRRRCLAERKFAQHCQGAGRAVSATRLSLSKVRLAGSIATTSLFNLIALAALVKDESGGHIGHRASYVDVSTEALPKPVQF